MRWIAIVIVALSAAAGCGDVNTALRRSVEARQASSDLLAQFTKAADAANRAVMANTDERSVAFAREAEEAKEKVLKDLATLEPTLRDLRYTAEAQLLQEFATRFDEYRALDSRILDLAVENTNLKAQRLSFGPAQEAADAFRDSIEALASSAAAKDAWQAKALAASAVVTVREIEVLHAPHIAEADDAVMTHMEKRMGTSEATARNALESLGRLVPPASRSRLTEATASLDRFMALHVQILALSRQNTNVRSLALSLDEKRKLVEPCEQSLRALQDALAKRGYPKGR